MRKNNFLQKYILHIHYLYIYQTTEYDTNKFLIYIKKGIFNLKIYKKLLKDRIDFTFKIYTYLVFTIILQIITFLLLLNTNIILDIIILILIYILTPIYILISNIFVIPIFFISKSILVKKAQRKVDKIDNLKIIAVNGSFGKSSTVSFIYSMLKDSTDIFTPTIGVNTIIGISREIIDKMPEKTKILLLEIGAYKEGEILEVIKKFPPDISVITEIGIEHLERFKSFESIIKSETESIRFSKEQSTIIIPKKLVKKRNIPILDNREYIYVSSKIQTIKNFTTYFSMTQNDTTISFHTKLLGKANINNLALALSTVLLFEKTNIQGRINRLVPLKQRLNPTVQNKILTIDDTYNISYKSGKNGILTLANLKKMKEIKRSVIATGGIVELGNKSSRVNKKYGTLLDKYVDLIILFDTPYRKSIMSGIDNKKKILEYSGYKELYKDLPKILKSKDGFLMQNEIPDEYYI